MDSHRRMKGSVKKDEPRNNSGNCGGLLMGTSCSYLPSSGLQGQKKRGEGRSFGQGPITSSMEKRVSPRSRLPPSSNGNIFLKIFPFHHLSVLSPFVFIWFKGVNWKQLNRDESAFGDNTSFLAIEKLPRVLPSSPERYSITEIHIRNCILPRILLSSSKK